MAGRVIDLNRPHIELPETMLLDTSVAVPAFLPMLRRSGPAPDLALARASAFLDELRFQSVAAYIAPASFIELAHLIVRRRFTHDLPKYPNPTTGRPALNWTRLYKARPALIRQCAADIERLRATIETAGTQILQSTDLAPIPSSRRFEQELIRLMRRYRLDSGDVAILIEASRAGIGAVVSEDPDWRRASRDFDVYTWL